MRHVLAGRVAQSLRMCPGGGVRTTEVPVHIEPAREFALECSPMAEAYKTMDLPFYGAYVERSGGTCSWS
jgi:hypothetical protein